MGFLDSIWVWVAGAGVALIILFLIFLVFETIFLRIGVKNVKGANTSFGDVFLTALINWLLTPLLCIGCILQLVVIMSRHKTTFGKAIKVWLISVLIPLAIALGITLLLGVLLPTIFGGLLP